LENNLFNWSGKYIAIEGVIGIGKTTLAHLLSDRLGGNLILEVVEGNPFLKDFYINRAKYSFQTQIFFLMNRYSQQEELRQTDMFKRTIISDYLFEKDRIFAYLNLDENELKLYEKLYEFFASKITVPDLVIYLQASTEVIMERIRQRGRDFEKEISNDYIENLNNAYNYFFFHYDTAPLLVVSCNSVDFVNNPTDFEELVKEINSMNQGKRYFNPSGK
jgi:deoxyadenosine/deoxycytidine kinase